MTLPPKPDPAGPGHALGTSLQEGLTLLVQAYQYAEELQRPLCDFAVELAVLREAGLTTSDLRWLVCRGFVRHYIDSTPPRAKRRTVHKADHLGLTGQSCFVLTAAGVALAAQGGQAAGGPHNARLAMAPADPPTKPRWDGELRELWFGRHLLKRQRRPAPNQDLILASFEEEGWRPRIDDPLPPLRDRDPVQCLHDTIKRLNASLLRPLVRFHCDGTGRGVRWEATP